MRIQNEGLYQALLGMARDEWTICYIRRTKMESMHPRHQMEISFGVKPPQFDPDDEPGEKREFQIKVAIIGRQSEIHTREAGLLSMVRQVFSLTCKREEAEGTNEALSVFRLEAGEGCISITSARDIDISVSEVFPVEKKVKKPEERVYANYPLIR